MLVSLYTLGVAIGPLVVLGAVGLTAWSGRLDLRDGFADREEGIAVTAH